ncbi:hypothetical protein ACUXQ2_003626 [Cupriavidus metallidurans]
MILASLRGLAVPLVLSAAPRLARTASLHFDSASNGAVVKVGRPGARDGRTRQPRKYATAPDPATRPLAKQAVSR